MSGSQTTNLLGTYFSKQCCDIAEATLVWLLPRHAATTALDKMVARSELASSTSGEMKRRNYTFECVNWVVLGMAARVLMLTLNESGRLVLCWTSLIMAFFALHRVLACVERNLVSRKSDNLAHGLENKLLQKFTTIATTVNQALEEAQSVAIRPHMLHKINLLRKVHLDCELAALQCKRFSNHLSSESSPPSSSTPSNGVGSVNQHNMDNMLPKALIFAILDDSALVRKNVERICRRHLQASPRSFFRGVDATECMEFIDEIIANKVDVAIVDENLDFEGQSLSGTTIAEMAQMRGYKGCLVRHSAQSTSRIRAKAELFHGVIEKTSSREVFEENLGRAWSNHVHKHID